MLSSELIRSQVASLLRGHLCLDDFEDWLVASSWNVLQHADAEVRQAVGAIELRLAEYSSGHLDYAELVAELQALITHHPSLPRSPQAPRQD